MSLTRSNSINLNLVLLAEKFQFLFISIFIIYYSKIVFLGTPVLASQITSIESLPLIIVFQFKYLSAVIIMSSV
jgi:hypothetical protein